MSKKEASIKTSIQDFINTNDSESVSELYQDLVDIFGKESHVLDFNQKLKLAIKDIESSADKIDYDGKKYTTVSKRIEVLRKYFGLDVSIKTENISINDSVIIFKATLLLHTEKGIREIATGHAEEKRTSSKINEVAAFEVAETSAIGRALGNAGLNGGEFASANEMSAVGAIKSKASEEVLNHLKELSKTSKTPWKAALATQGVKDENELTDEQALKLMNIFLKSISNNKKNSKTNEKINADKAQSKPVNQETSNEEDDDPIAL